MSATKDFNGSLDKIRSYKPKVDEVLQCSPFEAMKNLKGYLTPELFFEKLLVRTEEMGGLEAELIETLTSELQNNRIVFLEGYSGTGKTTFIKDFLDRHVEFASVYIDFSTRQSSPPAEVHIIQPDELKRTESDLLKVRTHLNEAEKLVIDRAIGQLSTVRQTSEDIGNIGSQTHPIATVLQRHLGKPTSEIEEFLYYLQDTRHALSEYFETFAEPLSQLEPPTAKTQLLALWQKATLRDTFILLLLFYVNQHKKQPEGESKLCLIIFDNLDTVDVAYLSPFFRESFANALGIFSLLLQDPEIHGEEVVFEHDFKFIFCLRDVNNSTVNPHLSDRIQSITENIHLRVGFEGELYETALTRRLAFYSEVSDTSPQNDQEIVKVVKMLRAFAKDQFFTRILVPLYNSDFRKLTSSLFRVTIELLREPRQSAGLSFEKVSDSFAENSNDEYGVRGALLFGLIKRLKDDNFLGNYPFTTDAPNENTPYCLITRMLLTVLLNKSKLARGDHVFNKRKPFGDVALGLILKECRDIYEIRDIMTNLVDVFMFHKQSWVHLITFRDRQVDDAATFAKDIAGLTPDSEITASLYNVMLSMSPAGYIFLKNVLVHFEFYSVLKDNRSPLFPQGLKRSERDPKRFEFEETLKTVYGLVKRHSEAMKKFLELKFEQSARGMSKQDYLSSEFTFKHFGYGPPVDKGLFHATRIVSQHVDYVDFFRLWLLHNPETPPEVKIEVNNKLVDWIARYLDLLEDWPDGLSRKKADMLKNIQTIRKASFSDFSTRINLPTRPADSR